MKEGQIVSMEADADKGALRFWLDGKQHGPGFMSGVEGRVRWAVGLSRGVCTTKAELLRLCLHQNCSLGQLLGFGQNEEEGGEESDEEWSISTLLCASVTAVGWLVGCAGV
jgi:hypothetical protein